MSRDDIEGAVLDFICQNFAGGADGSRILEFFQKNSKVTWFPWSEFFNDLYTN